MKHTINYHSKLVINKNKAIGEFDDMSIHHTYVLLLLPRVTIISHIIKRGPLVQLHQYIGFGGRIPTPPRYVTSSAIIDFFERAWMGMVQTSERHLNIILDKEVEQLMKQASGGD